MTFEAGKSGNPGGRPKLKPFKDALMMEALSAERGEKCIAKKGSLRWNARKLLELGEVPAIKEIADRLDGKVTQAISGPDGGPIQTIDLTNVSADDLERLEALFGPLAGGSGDDDESNTGGEGEAVG
ncbi:hypothetical protein EPK99_06505 [Neorhizobium lilium]|uniref:DUF5681 domain-containing protein n=1 Tax=Neorhizobium lilium TaxID=2503024 RepID=A0A3S3VJV2_9HYPH|nr:hypothetical protein [Neorhizobium lilium]RWX78279.1 hypothetical protein EPK99_06505 [Neorhizobium lilium]